MRINLIVSCLLFSSLSVACQKLPGDLLTYIKSLDTSYLPIEKNQLSDDVFWVSRDSDACLVGDFDGDKQTDYALLLNSRETYVSAIVFLKRDSSFIHKIIKDDNYGPYYDDNKVTMVMTPVRGKVIGINETVQLENLGVQISDVLGSTSSVFYWKNDDFVKIRISD